MVNKKIILSILIIGCIATVAGAGTWAYYTSSATSSGNSFTAGNMNISVTQEIGNVSIKPGDELGDKTIVVKNGGSIAIGKINLTYKPSNNQLSQHIEFSSVDIDGKQIAKKGVLSDLSSQTSVYEPDNPIQPGNSFKITLNDLKMDDKVTEGQGQTSTLVITLEAEQVHK
ncbi:hypothetical protein ASJ81_01350 [Methanosarcina spelaei]|uniref:Uncharacterized protein n=1 Tax=Methanosarcina spelaei TaxID=1036679 RepID=A0A2A2HTJ9_9EURY|nr:TasA family protein [Methanosarcina spelaei]PAV12554.1 hypothetical protein ASJ81_01350 [Methanosarcina spelaei]